MTTPPHQEYFCRECGNPWTAAPSTPPTCPACSGVGLPMIQKEKEMSVENQLADFIETKQKEYEKEGKAAGATHLKGLALMLRMGKIHAGNAIEIAGMESIGKETQGDIAGEAMRLTLAGLG